MANLSFLQQTVVFFEQMRYEELRKIKVFMTSQNGSKLLSLQKWLLTYNLLAGAFFFNDVWKELIPEELTWGRI